MEDDQDAGSVYCDIGICIYLVGSFSCGKISKRVPVSYEEQFGDGIYNALKPSLILMQKKQLISMIFSEN